MEDFRKLVTVRKIDKIKPIPNADIIEVAILGGWEVVVRKNDNYKVGDKVLYFEIDSFLPNTIPQFDFFQAPDRTKTMEINGKDVNGYVLKTARMRGQISQGLIMRLESFPDLEEDNIEEYFKNLGVVKYEKELPIAAINDFPNYVLKTDSLRVQNLTNEFLSIIDKESPVKIPTEKIDGTSRTYWKDKDGKLHICGKNWEIKATHADRVVIKKYNLDKELKPLQYIQGELFGPKIQSNRLKLKEPDYRIFTFKSEDGSTLSENLEKIKVPVYDLEFPKTLEEAVAQVNGLKSLINPNVMSEGVVWHLGRTYQELNCRNTFKAINNKYLLK